MTPNRAQRLGLEPGSVSPRRADIDIEGWALIDWDAVQAFRRRDTRTQGQQP